MRKELKYSFKKWPKRKWISSEIIPHYCKKSNEWRRTYRNYYGIITEDRDGIAFLMDGFANYGEVYYYQTDEHGHSDHGHSLSDVLCRLFFDPTDLHFEGFEYYYSPQQLKLIKAAQKKLLAMGKKWDIR